MRRLVNFIKRNVAGLFGTTPLAPLTPKLPTFGAQPPILTFISSRVKIYSKNKSYVGASLEALEHWTKRSITPLELILWDSDAFFVRNDLRLEEFDAPFTAEHHNEAREYFLEMASGHPNRVGRYTSL